MEKTRVTKQDYFGVLRGLVEGAELENKDAVLEFVTTSDEFNAYFNDVMDKYTKGMRF